MPVSSTLAQVRRASDGRLIPVDGDVFDVCQRIREVDRSLGVEFNLKSEQYRIYEEGDDGVRRTVKWVAELTPDLPEHLRQLLHTDYARELERVDRQAERDAAHAFHERVGPVGERLAHAVRKDLGIKRNVVIPKGI